MYTVLGSVLGFRASFRSASPLPSTERRFSATAPVVGSVLPFEETKAGRDSQLTVISRARGVAHFPPREGSNHTSPDHGGSFGNPPQIQDLGLLYRSVPSVPRETQGSGWLQTSSQHRLNIVSTSSQHRLNIVSTSSQH